MAKEKNTEVAVEQPKKVAPPKKEIKKDTWEVKDRKYILKGNKNPLTLTIPTKHTTKHSLLYFDAESRKQRELRYATNQASPFVDEQKGEVTLGHIVFREGALIVKKENQALQKLLSLYHPLKNKVYKEFDTVEIAEDQLDILELQIEALNAAKNMDIDHAEAILRVEVGSKVSKMSSKELKRDLLLFASKNPFSAFAAYLKTDEGVEVYRSIDKKLG